MKLHENEELFKELISDTASYINLPEVYIEKDYWVTNALKNLNQSEYLNDVVFKGGTSLSKAYRLIDRFSEDLDLAIIDHGLSGNARKEKIRSVEKVVSAGLNEVLTDPRLSKGSKFRRTVYEYPKVLNDDLRSASPQLLVEINAFTIPEPNQLCDISSLIAQALTSFNKVEIITEYELASFSINVLSVKRTLVEKIMRCVKYSYSENPTAELSNGIRHLYDICKILDKEEYRKFITTSDFTDLCGICIANEKDTGLDGSEHLDKPLHQAPLFTKFSDMRKQLDAQYNTVFKDLVYDSLPDMDKIADALELIRREI